MNCPKLIRCAALAGSLAPFGSLLAQIPVTAPPTQPQKQPAEAVSPIKWRKSGTIDPDAPPLFPQPVVIPASGEQPAAAPVVPATTPAPPAPLPPAVAAPAPAPVRVDPRPLPRFPHGYHDPTHPIGPGSTSAAPVTPASTPAPVPTPPPAVPAWPGPPAAQSPVWRTGGQEPVLPNPALPKGTQPQPTPPIPTQPQPMPMQPGGTAPNTGDGTGSSGNPGGGTGDPAKGASGGSSGSGGGGQKPPATWHGHKYPVQPMQPAGASPVAPTDEGYYTLLQLIQGEPVEKPPRWPYPRGGPIGPPFNEISFTYLDAIPFDQRDWAERLKRVPVGDHFLFSTGGELRYRYDYEKNTRLSGVNDTYDLFRTRVYGDLWYEDVFRTYMEFYYGDTANQDFTPYARDIDRGDIQQLFVDLKVWDFDGNPVYVRGGRQEMFYGSQRLISTNDWGNNRPRFDGVKAFYRSEKLDADAFAVRPTLNLPNKLDTWDVHSTFSGAWLTYKPKKGTFIDGYYLDLDNVNRDLARGQFRSGGFNVSTFGGRYYTRADSGLLVDFEGMLQFGHWADQSILAQAFSTYLGWYFKDVWAEPTFWVGYDYASGDPDPNNTGQHRTFNQLFQFGHYYYGFIDITGGQNMRDFNVQAYAYPMKWLTTGAQYHVFRLDSNRDALYNSAGVPIRQDRTGKAGNDVGSELDLLVNLHLTDRQDIFLNYCHFFTGSYIRATGNATNSVPLDYVYAQYTMRW